MATGNHDSRDSINRRRSQSVSQSVKVMGEVRGSVDFPTIGIGASAGGLEAFEVFFKACPFDTGMAAVLVSHLDPNHKYVIPPNRDMAILNGVLLKQRNCHEN